MLIKRKLFCKPSLLCVILLGISGLMLLTTSHYFLRPSEMVADPVPPKMILSWTNFFGIPDLFPSTLDGLGCSVDNCLTSNNRSLVKESDAVIFHWYDVNVTDMPYKSSKQKWVLYNYEPPSQVEWQKVKPVVEQMTFFAMYHSESDIDTPYGQYARKSLEEQGLSDFSLTLEEFSKKKPIAWLVSKCFSSGRRENFVKDMKSHIQVDVFGGCGVSPPCEKFSTHKNRIFCHRELAKLYKFYLSFENDVCKDYATEKPFLPLRVGMVPVVFGGANYSRILPPNSFIDALAFQTPKDLADYLLEVGRNFTLYQSYHKWRDAYKIVQYEAPNFNWLCDMCRILHEEKPRKSVVPHQRDLFYEWFFVGSKCRHWTQKTDPSMK